MAEMLAHETVLLHEAVAALQVRPAGVYIDGTYGRGGHSAEIVKQLGEAGRLVVIDKDPEAIRHAQECYQDDPRVFAWQGSFRDFPMALADAGVPGQVDGMLLDLGVSSPQLDDAARGFSFMRDGELDMRMDPGHGLSAREWLMQADEREIADVLWRYGEERFSRQIARAVVRSRVEHPLERTLQLAELVAKAVPKREKGKNPATRSFQAIRIKVNQELDDVEACLQAIVGMLTTKGRLVVISFHSLEDRIVKHFLREQSTAPRLPKGLPVMGQDVLPIMGLVGKAVRASEQEVGINVRSRSAIMRTAEKN